MPNIPKLKFWCQNVLPVVYDDSLSYYELLAKVVDYLNNVISDLNLEREEIDFILSEINTINNKLDNFNDTIIAKLVKEYLASMIFIEINNDGYIVYNIPNSWRDITFNTTGVDVRIDGVEPGRLVLSY